MCPIIGSHFAPELFVFSSKRRFDRSWRVEEFSYLRLFFANLRLAFLCVYPRDYSLYLFPYFCLMNHYPFKPVQVGVFLLDFHLASTVSGMIPADVPFW